MPLKPARGRLLCAAIAALMFPLCAFGASSTATAAATVVPSTVSLDTSAELPALSGIDLSEPVPGAEITSPFGWRVHPILKRRRFHEGVDFGAPRGTPVLAAADGVIEEMRRHGHYGLYIRIRHSDRVETAYAHMAHFRKGLHKGDHVHRGQIIATVGTSGWATGPHLYYEVIVDGNRIDPMAAMVQAHLRRNVKPHATLGR